MIWNKQQKCAVDFLGVVGTVETKEDGLEDWIVLGSTRQDYSQEKFWRRGKKLAFTQEDENVYVDGRHVVQTLPNGTQRFWKIISGNPKFPKK